MRNKGGKGEGWKGKGGGERVEGGGPRGKSPHYWTFFRRCPDEERILKKICEICGKTCEICGK
jgi:hypothetical protein